MWSTFGNIAANLQQGHIFTCKLVSWQTYGGLLAKLRWTSGKLSSKLMAMMVLERLLSGKLMAMMVLECLLFAANLLQLNVF